jgi:hypothetical protein
VHKAVVFASIVRVVPILVVDGDFERKRGARRVSVPHQFVNVILDEKLGASGAALAPDQKPEQLPQLVQFAPGSLHHPARTINPAAPSIPTIAAVSKAVKVIFILRFPFRTG